AAQPDPGCAGLPRDLARARRARCPAALPVDVLLRPAGLRTVLSLLRVPRGPRPGPLVGPALAVRLGGAEGEQVVLGVALQRSRAGAVVVGHETLEAAHHGDRAGRRLAPHEL